MTVEIDQRTALDNHLQLLRGVTPSDLQALEWEVKVLQGIAKWAREQLPIQAGDRVKIQPSLKLTQDSAPGWWPFREALAPGQTGTAQSVSFNPASGAWSAAVLLDTEWVAGNPRRSEGRSEFYIRLNHLWRITP